MSGHSHWATIKRKKGAEDAKRGKVFSKLNREITVAVREGGANPENNPKLRMLFDKAREANMPKDNVDRILKKASGELQGEILSEFLFEIIGPGEIAVLVEGITDNKNRALADIKKVLSKMTGKLVSEGALKWQFTKKGYIDVLLKGDKEENEMNAIDAGAEDIVFSEEMMTIFTSPDQVDSVRKNLEEKMVVKDFGMTWLPNEKKEVSDNIKESLGKLFDALDDSDDVQEIYTNADL